MAPGRSFQSIQPRPRTRGRRGGLVVCLGGALNLPNRTWPASSRRRAKAGVDVCVKIAADGSITIATGMPGELNGDAANPWDEVLNDTAEQKRTA